LYHCLVGFSPSAHIARSTVACTLFFFFFLFQFGALHSTLSTPVDDVQVYQPLEFLLFVAAISTVVEAVLPPLVAVQKETVRIVVRTMLSLTYVIASAFVVFNIKARIVQEKRWRAELSGVFLFSGKQATAV
jgi:hypothetical protein